MPLPPKIYQSPPGSGGNDGALPTTYDINWPFYTNLTPDQVTAFQAFPQDLSAYCRTVRWNTENGAGITSAGIPVMTTDRDQTKIAQIQTGFLVTPSANIVQFHDAQGGVHALGQPQIKIMFTNIVTFVEKTFTTSQQTIAAINATPPTITTRAQVDAAFAAIPRVY
jgi:hypothetical protein